MGFFSSMVGSSVVGVGSSIPWWDLVYSGWVLQFLGGIFCSPVGFFRSMVGSSVFGVACCGFFHSMPRTVVLVAGS